MSTNTKLSLQKNQRGAALITAVFLITGLAVLGSLMTKVTIMSSDLTIREWYSSQALFAAESGIDWGGWYIEQNLQPTAPPCPVTYTSAIQEVMTNKSWFSVSITCNSRPTPATSTSDLYLYEITSTGSAGGATDGSSPKAQRQIKVQYIP